MGIGGDLGVRSIGVFCSCTSISAGRFIRSRRRRSLLYAYDIVGRTVIQALAFVIRLSVLEGSIGVEAGRRNVDCSSLLRDPLPLAHGISIGRSPPRQFLILLLLRLYSLESNSMRR